jgi:hypothetical protein
MRGPARQSILANRRKKTRLGKNTFGAAAISTAEIIARDRRLIDREV